MPILGSGAAIGIEIGNLALGELSDSPFDPELPTDLSCMTAVFIFTLDSCMTRESIEKERTS